MAPYVSNLQNLVWFFTITNLPIFGVCECADRHTVQFWQVLSLLATRAVPDIVSWLMLPVDSSPQDCHQHQLKFWFFCVYHWLLFDRIFSWNPTFFVPWIYRSLYFAIWRITYRFISPGDIWPPSQSFVSSNRLWGLPGYWVFYARSAPSIPPKLPAHDW